MPVFRHRSEHPYPPETVFAWHERPGAFQRLVPPWSDVRVREMEGGIEEGGRVSLQLRQGPISLEFSVRHTDFERGRLFSDEQTKGPFRIWRHRHRFEPLGNGSTAVIDEIEWELPFGGVLGFGGAFVETELRRSFRFRHERLAHDLALHHRYGGGADKKLRVAITGSSGLLGSALVHLLRSGGHEVLRLVRNRDQVGPGRAFWDPIAGELDPRALEGMDAVVHLAGETIAAVRWTEEKKKRIYRSRVLGTRTVAESLAKLGDPKIVLVNSSAVGYYGATGERLVDETTKAGKGFLAEVAEAWEDATRAARNRGIRVVLARTGPVLSPAGGALPVMLRPFQFGLGGRLGSVQQYMSWIDHDDAVGLIYHAIATPSIEGPLNVTAPHPVTNAALTDTLGRVLGRPTLIPAPSLAVRAVMGRAGQELLLSGQRVMPRRALDSGYRFFFPDLEDSLRFELGREDVGD